MHINQFTVDKRLIGMYFKYPWGSLGFLGVKRRTQEHRYKFLMALHTL